MAAATLDKGTDAGIASETVRRRLENIEVSLNNLEFLWLRVAKGGGFHQRRLIEDFHTVFYMEKFSN